MKTIAITGARGFLGVVLAEYFSSKGYSVRRLVRDTRGEVGTYRFDLADGFDEAALLNVDVLIHAAHDFTPLSGEEMKRVNIEGSRKLFAAATRAHIPKIIFISSVSAFPGCASLYGNAKLEIEGIVRQEGGMSVRPGLIYGREGKGMFGALEKIVSKLPLVPVFDGGGQPMVLAHVDDIAAALTQIIEKFDTLSGEPVTLANAEEISFKILLQRIARGKGKRPRFISIPSSLALFGLRASESIGIRLPFRSDSLVGLLNANPSLVVSPEVGEVMRPFLSTAQVMGRNTRE